MKIDNSIKSLLTGSVQNEARPGKSAKGANRDTQTPSTSVQVSPLAAQLQQIESQLGSGDVADAARVAEIKQAITDGRFRINPEVIADRLLETVKQLIQGYKA